MSRSIKTVMRYFGTGAAAFLCIGILAIRTAGAQSVNALKIDQQIKIDGILDEPLWGIADSATNFTQFEPEYGTPSPYRTRVKIAYDNRNIYFGVECLDPDKTKISAKITKRDGDTRVRGAFNLELDDAIVIMLDTFDDKNNAYFFLVNPLGTQQDGKMADNGRTKDSTWDASWTSAAAINGDGWSAEIAIPFSSLRYNTSMNEWGLNIGRSIPRSLEKSYWVPNLIDKYRVSQFGRLTDLNLNAISSKKYTLIPYGQTQFQKDKSSTGNIGIDAAYSFTSNASLDATINPDFATIEADVEKINLTRFELSFAEKRPFFLEGAENYSTRIKQFYSRRIGEIPWGMKLNSKVDNWKINVLTTQSDPTSAGSDEEAGHEAIYSVFRINRELSNGSNIGILAANRRFRDKNSGSVGLVTTLFFTDVFGMTSQVVKSYGYSNSGTWTMFFRPSYDSQFSHFHIRYTHVGEGVMENINPVGFIRDDDRREFDTNIRRIFWINSRFIESITPSVNYNQYWSQKGNLRSWVDSNRLSIKIRKKWDVQFSYNEEFKLYEKEFRNRVFEEKLTYDTKAGRSLSVSYGTGRNFDRDFEKFTGNIDAKIVEGWNVTYNFTRLWFNPDPDDENSWIHYVRSTYYTTKDLYFKLFYQTKYLTSRGFFNPDFELDRKTLQIAFVWRFMPPFGSIQLAYQEGTARFSDVEDRGKTLFSKLSWVF